MSPSPTLEKRGVHSWHFDERIHEAREVFTLTALRRVVLRACEHHQDKDFVAFRVEVQF